MPFIIVLIAAVAGVVTQSAFAAVVIAVALAAVWGIVLLFFSGVKWIAERIAEKRAL